MARPARAAAQQQQPQQRQRRRQLATQAVPQKQLSRSSSSGDDGQLSRCDGAQTKTGALHFHSRHSPHGVLKQDRQAHRSRPTRRNLPRVSFESWASPNLACVPSVRWTECHASQVPAPHRRRSRDESAMPRATPHGREARCDAASVDRSRIVVLLISMCTQVDLELRAHHVLRGRVKTARCASRNVLPVLSARHVASDGALHERRGC